VAAKGVNPTVANVSCLRWAIALMSLAVITNKANTLVPGELHEGVNEIAHFSFH